MTAVLTPEATATVTSTEAVVPEVDRPIGRATLVLTSIGLFVMCLLQAPGRLVADTKLDIAVAPQTFLGHALNLWTPQQEFGGVPFQAYGYLFPMGPFFLIGHLLHVPTWVVQRLWLAALLSAGFWGVVRLAEALHIGSAPSRVIAGLAFVLAPPVSLLGLTSSYILPFALLPWVMVPLVKGAEGGSPRRAAARSGVALLLMGGINAAATIAILPLPILWFLTRTRGPRRRQLFTWWVVAGFLACAWWAGCLLLEVRYGFNLLPYTESSGTTTAPTSLFNMLTGNSYWVAFDQIGPAALKSGLDAVTSPLMILAGAALGALGLFGLAHRSMKERVWLVGSLAAGLVLVGAGYAGIQGDPFAGRVQDLLSGSLALFRNVWKFQPIVNLALVLGLAHGLAVAAGSLKRVAGTLQGRHRARLVALPLAALAVIGVAIPFLSGDFFPPGSFSTVPGYWSATANWIDAHAGNTTSLVVPGTSVGVYRWGSPLDEPMQWLSSSDWAIRGLIPDGSVGSIETMDAVDGVLNSGVPNPGLAEFLAQSGVHYVVERNDLAPAAGAPTPLQVHQVLVATPGLTSVAKFGPPLVVRYLQFRLALPAVEIYRVDGPVDPVVTAPVANSVVVSGGAQGLLALDEVGLSPGNRAVFLAGDGGQASKGQTWVVTDTSPRTGVVFGATRYNQTYVLTAGETNPVTGKAPEGFTIVPGVAHQTVATYLGAKDIAASSFGSNYLFESPEDQPSAAMDGNLDTAWVANAANDSVGQWLQVDFNSPIGVKLVGLNLTDSSQTPRVTEVTVSTANGSLVERVNPSGAGQVVHAPAGPTSWLRVTFTSALPPVRSSTFPRGAGIRELSLFGVSVKKAEVVPSDELSRFGRPGARPATFVFTSSVPGSAYGVRYGGDDAEPQMARVFTTPSRETFDVSGTMTARPGASLAALLKFLGANALRARVLHVPCGQGPVVTIDGQPIQTQVNGLFGGLNGFRQLRFSACGGPVTVAAGRHLLEGNVGGYLKIISVALSPAAGAPYASAPGGSVTRSVTVTGWGPEHRTVAVGPGNASYLVVRENANSGWTATLHGRTLASARVNGWQQAWVVPKGEGGVVTLTYGPDRVYQVWLLIGAAFALALTALALLRGRRRSEPDEPDALGSTDGLPTVAAIVVAAAVLVFLGGALALVLPVLLLIAWLLRSNRWLPLFAGLSFMLAGVAVARHIGTTPLSGMGAFGRPAQIASLVAIASVLASVIVETRWWRTRRQPRSAPDPSLE
jgi:arabinofuranan 3-O-arabinosyltransferase